MRSMQTTWQHWGFRAAAWLDRFLTRRRVKNYTLLLFVMATAGYLVLLLRGTPPLLASGEPIAVDFLAHVVGGRLALDGALGQLYDVAAQHATQARVLGVAIAGLDLYLSPPFVALLYAPFAALPYVWGAAIWQLLSLALLALSLRLLWPLVPNLHRWGMGLVALVVCASAPFVDLLGSGQDTALSLALLVIGLRLLLARRDVAAGMVLALLLHKPQLALLLPLLFVADRRWRALGAWCVVGALLAGLSLGLVGLDGARGYVQLLTSDVYRAQIALALNWKMLSLPALFRSVGIGASELVIIPLGAGLCTWLMLRLPTTTQRMAVLVLGTLLVSPHLFLYDGLLLALPALLLLDRAPRDQGLRGALVAIYVLTWCAPLGAVGLAVLPWTAAIIALILARLASEAMRQPAALEREAAR